MPASRSLRRHQSSPAHAGGKHLIELYLERSYYTCEHALSHTQHPRYSSLWETGWMFVLCEHINGHQTSVLHSTLIDCCHLYSADPALHAICFPYLAFHLSGREISVPITVHVLTTGHILLQGYITAMSDAAYALCWICQVPATTRCMGCQQASYCSQQHLLLVRILCYCNHRNQSHAMLGLECWTLAEMSSN